MLNTNTFLARPQTDQISHALKYFLFPFDNEVKTQSIRSIHVYFWSDASLMNLYLHIRTLRLGKTGLFQRKE